MIKNHIAKNTLSVEILDHELNTNTLSVIRAGSFALRDRKPMTWRHLVMKARLPGQKSTRNVIIEKVYLDMQNSVRHDVTMQFLKFFLIIDYIDH